MVVKSGNTVRVSVSFEVEYQNISYFTKSIFTRDKILTRFCIIYQD